MAQTFSELVGIEIQPVYSVGEQALLALAAKYPDELEYIEGAISFCSDDFVFSIETDMTEQGDKPVYSASCMSFNPKTIIFDTGWMTSLPRVINAFKKKLAELEDE